MKRQLKTIVMGIAISSVALTGCASDSPGASGGGDGDQVTLQFFHRWPNEPFNEYFNSVIADFEEQNPNIKIDVISALNDQYKQKINVVLANNNPPDIYFSWAGEYGQKFVREGKALDLTSYYNQDKEWADQIISSTIEPFSHEDKIYGVPFMASAKFFYYNKTIFDNLGLEAPDTWDEFIHVLDTLQAESGIIPLGVGNKAPWVAGAYITTLNARMVPAEVLAKDYAAATGEFTHPGYVEALEKLQQLIPYMNDQPNAVSFEEERNMFINQQVAISYEETSGFRFFKELPFEWGFFQLPAIEGGEGDQEIMTGAPEGFMISSQTKHPEEAMEFLKFLLSEENGAKYVADTNYVSVVAGAINEDTSPHPLMIEAANRIIEAEAMAQWIDTLTDSRVASPYMAALQGLLNNEKTPEDVMKEVQAAANDLRASAK